MATVQDEPKQVCVTAKVDVETHRLLRWYLHKERKTIGLLLAECCREYVRQQRALRGTEETPPS